MTDGALMDERIAEYKRAIESIVLVAHDPVPAELLAQLLEEPTVMVEQWCEELAEAYVAAGHGFELVHIAGGWRFQTASDLTPYVERFLLHDQRARLSGAALETLAIVAYKQPISRGQIASIRGVDPDGVLRTLQATGLHRRGRTRRRARVRRSCSAPPRRSSRSSVSPRSTTCRRSPSSSRVPRSSRRSRSACGSRR